jgi:hypothetical protein
LKTNKNPDENPDLLKDFKNFDLQKKIAGHCNFQGMCNTNISKQSQTEPFEPN